jgi:hypothetical protein
MSAVEVQTFIIAFAFLMAIGFAGWLWAERRARSRAREQGTDYEPTGRGVTVALILAAILLDGALALVWVLLRRQSG